MYRRRVSAVSKTGLAIVRFTRTEHEGEPVADL